MSRELAGNLTSRFVGSSVEVTYQDGNIESTVRDMIEKIVHSSEGVRLFFKGTRWSPHPVAITLGAPVDLGLLVPPNAYVTIKDN